MKSYSESTARLLGVITPGKANAVPREELRELTGWKDREMRRKISLARLEGVPICNDQDGKGYYIPTKADEIRAQLKQVKARASVLLKQLAPLSRKIAALTEALEGQLEFELEEDGSIERPE